MNGNSSNWQDIIISGQLNQMSMAEQTQFVQTIPAHYLVLGFMIGAIIPAIITMIAATIVNVPKRNFFSAYLATTLSAVASLATTICLIHMGVTTDIVTLPVCIFVTILVYYLCFDTTLLKAIFILALSAILEILAIILLGILIL